MGKRNIYFCPDVKTYEHLCGTMSGVPASSYMETEEYIKNKADNIITMSIAHFSYDLKNPENDYNIFLCHGNNIMSITYDSCPEDSLIGYNLLDGFKRGDFSEVFLTPEQRAY